MPPSSKRRTDRQLTKDDASDEEPSSSTDGGGFRRANAATLSGRKIISRSKKFAKRAAPAPTPAAETASPNPFGRIELKSKTEAKALTFGSPASDAAPNPFAGVALKAAAPGASPPFTFGQSTVEAKDSAEKKDAEKSAPFAEKKDAEKSAPFAAEAKSAGKSAGKSAPFAFGKPAAKTATGVPLWSAPAAETKKSSGEEKPFTASSVKAVSPKDVGKDAMAEIQALNRAGLTPLAYLAATEKFLRNPPPAPATGDEEASSAPATGDEEASSTPAADAALADLRKAISPASAPKNSPAPAPAPSPVPAAPPKFTFGSAGTSFSSAKPVEPAKPFSGFSFGTTPAATPKAADTKAKAPTFSFGSPPAPSPAPGPPAPAADDDAAPPEPESPVGVTIDKSEKSVYEVRAKLFRYTKEWRDCGVTTVRLLQNVEHARKKRVVVRTKLGKVELNTSVGSGFKFEKFETKKGSGGIKFFGVDADGKEGMVMLKVAKDNLAKFVEEFTNFTR